MKKSSKSRLTINQQEQFPGTSLFARIARTVCRAGTLPAKELFEAWEMARRVRRRFRGGRVLDLACGHGLLAHIMLLLDDSSPEALAVDAVMPANARHLSDTILSSWPRLEGRIHHIAAPIESLVFSPVDLIVSNHACGSITDLVIRQAIGAGSRLAVLPCCHDVKQSDTGGLQGWIDGPLAVDVMRAARLRAAGYQVITQQIPADITPQNRLLMGYPGEPSRQ